MLLYVDDPQISFHRYKAVNSQHNPENSFHKCCWISREGSIQSIVYIPWKVKSTESVESILLYELLYRSFFQKIPSNQLYK